MNRRKKIEIKREMSIPKNEGADNVSEIFQAYFIDWKQAFVFNDNARKR